MDDPSDIPRSLALLQNLLRESGSTSVEVRFLDSSTWNLPSE